MKKGIKFKSLFIRLIKWVFIPVILVGLWIVLSLVRNSAVPFSVLLYDSKVINTSANYNNKLIKGSVVEGEFTAKQNYLGAITISFNPMDKVRYDEEDNLIFRIKEVGKGGWYSQNKYKSGIIQENPVFPFGFPSIPDSKNKLFQFEIVSLNGNSKNAVSINKNSSNLTVVYQFPTAEIRKNRMMFANFLFEKVLDMFSVGNYFVSSFIYLLPLIAYFYFMSKFKRKYSLVVLLIIFDCFFITGVYDWIFWSITLLWIISVWKLKLNSSLSFKLALLLLVLSFFFLLFAQQSIAEKTALWSYMFLAVGAIQQLILVRNDETET